MYVLEIIYSYALQSMSAFHGIVIMNKYIYIYIYLVLNYRGVPLLKVNLLRRNSEKIIVILN